ncbi:hypothetical protein DFQ28_011119 [Apophysomyces sp. BC1034]|nr:hypothetical protein DFQ30_007392 [Apophysomyces sp. BC1015]KAG0182735.1 hypothetical protein DFQ29_002370 [Apophysomyces sp. BC1021]KAG0191727.1 hypothetical protein DFQ28_011119 [Apophysomyces sp. BC1034]
MKTTTNNNAKDAKIPRPMNCFLAYRLEKQSEIVSRCPGANHRDISKIIAKWWREASEEEKAPYRERARLAKEKHEALYPDYKYAPQKKAQRKTRKYTIRPKNKFTSRSEENNRMMELLYEDKYQLSTAEASLQNHHHSNFPSMSPSSFSSSSFVWPTPSTPDSTKLQYSSLSSCAESSCASSIAGASPEYDYTPSMEPVYISYPTTLTSSYQYQPITPSLQSNSDLDLLENDSLMFSQPLLFQNCLDTDLSFSLDMSMPMNYPAPFINPFSLPLDISYNDMSHF